MTPPDFSPTHPAHPRRAEEHATRPPSSTRDALVLGTGCGNDVSLMRALIRQGWQVWFGGAEQGIAQLVRGLAGHVPLPADEAAALDALCAWSERLGRGLPVLIPTNDATVLLTWRNGCRLFHHFQVPTVPTEALPTLFFKERLQAACARLDIRHPRTVLELAAGAEPPAAPPALPLLAKPVAPKEPMLRDQATKVVTIRTEADWQDFVARRIPATAVLFTEFVPHHRKALCEAFVDRSGRLAFRNDYLVEFIHPPRDGNAVLCLPMAEPELAAGLERLTADTGYRGFVELEFIEHEETGEWFAIDVQCRPTLQNGGLVHNGLDFDLALRNLLEGTPYEGRPERGARHGWVDLVRLLRAVRSTDSPLRGRWGLWFGQLCSVLLGRTAEATFSWRDPRPFLADLRWSLRRG